MILHAYFARRFAVNFGLVLAGFTALIILTGLVEEIGDTSGAGIGALSWLAVLAAPGALYRLLPLMVILGGVAHFLALARSSELVVTRAAGRSAGRALLGPAFVVLVTGVLAVSAGNPIVAATSQKYANERAALRGETRQIAKIGANGLWLREGDAQGHRIIRANSSNGRATALDGVSVYEYGPTGAPVARIEAASARLIRGAWLLEGVKQWPLDSTAPEAGATLPQRLTLPSTLTEDAIRDSFGDPSALPIWDLPSYIAQLERAGFSARRHSVWLQAELAQPVFLLAMLVLAAGFTMGHPRGGGTGAQVLMAVLFGFGLYFVRNFVMVLGENGQLPPPLAAWAPPVAALMLALGLLLQREDG